MTMKKSLPLFAIITLLFVIAAWFSVLQHSPETVVEKVSLFPGLADQIQNIAKVDIKTRENEILLAEKDGQWVVLNHGGYPAKVNRLKPLVIAISKLKIREAKTANPELYPRLQVEDVSIEKAKSKQVILQDAKGKTMASLLVGKERKNRSDGTADSLYVRKSGEKQSYLVKGNVTFPVDPVEWMDNSLIDLSSERLKSITIDHGGNKTVQVSRKNKDAVNYELQDIPEWYQIKSQTTINSLASVVEELRFNDVNNSASFKWPDGTLSSVYKTFDGLVMKVKSAIIDDQIWAEFSFEFEGKEKPAKVDKDSKSEKLSVKQQVENLNAKTKGWVFALPSYKGKMLTRPLADLIIKEGEKKSTSAKTAPDKTPPKLPPGITPDMLEGMMQGSGQGGMPPK